MASADEAIALANKLSIRLAHRSYEANRTSDYYRGIQPLRFASSEFRDYFAKRYERFSDNWVQVVADSSVERLTVTGVRPAGAEKADQDLWRIWQARGLDVDSQLAFLGAVNTARAFALVWGNPDDESVPEVTFEDSTQAIVGYAGGSRRNRIAALKMWRDDKIEYATLYLADEVWKFSRRAALPDPYEDRRDPGAPRLIVPGGIDRQWAPRDTGDEPNPQPNPMGVVPMVELQNRPLLAADPVSDVSGVISMQDAINLLWAQLFTASDFASFPQRIVLGAERPVTPILDDNGQKIGERPVPLEKFAVDRVLWIEDENAKIDAWQAANLATYTQVLEVAVGHLAAQTRTPQHYLIGKMANLSGDALKAAETGLVKKCEEKKLWFGEGLREVFALVANAAGNQSLAEACTTGKVLWADSESRSEAQLVDALLKLKTIGFPFEFLAARYGLTPPEIADVVAMKERDAASDPLNALMNGKAPLSAADQQMTPPGPPQEQQPVTG